MACPTCDHTMQAIVDGKFWCPRCGTLKLGTTTESPMLVARVHNFIGLIIHVDVAKWAHASGVTESIERTAETPK